MVKGVDKKTGAEDVDVAGRLRGRPNGEIDWVFRSSGDDSAAWVLHTLQEAGVHIMGSGSHYDMAAYWPFSDSPMAAPMNEVPKVIFSRTGITDGTRAGQICSGPDETQRQHAHEDAVMRATPALQSWAEPNVVGGELTDEIEILGLKAQPANIILAHGGVRFAQSLVASRVVDECWVGDCLYSPGCAVQPIYVSSVRRSSAPA